MLITYELTAKWAIIEALIHIENAKTAIAFAFSDNTELSIRATEELDKAIKKIQMNRTECNVRPAGI